MADQGINIEVGSRNRPMIQHLRKDLMGPGSSILIDKRIGWLSDLVKGNVKEKEFLLTAHGAELPLESNSVSTILTKDLFGAQGYLAFPPWSEVLEDGVIEDIGENLPKEFYRVLKPGGKMILAEIATPPDKSELKQEFSEAGFRLVEEYNGLEYTRIFGFASTFSLINADAYSLVFEKPVDWEKK